MSDWKTLAAVVFFALVVVGWFIFAATRPTPAAPILEYHGTTSDAFQDLAKQLYDTRTLRDADLADIETTKETSTNEYVNDPDALCDAFDRLAR